EEERQDDGRRERRGPRARDAHAGGARRPRPQRGGDGDGGREAEVLPEPRRESRDRAGGGGERGAVPPRGARGDHHGDEAERDRRERVDERETRREAEEPDEPR